VSTGIQLDIVASKRGDLTVAQARLDGQQEDRAIAPSNPSTGVGSCHNGSALLLCEELYGTTIVTLRGDRKHTLTVQGQSWLAQGHVPKERVQSCETVVPRTGAIATAEFEMMQELAEEGRVKFLCPQFARRPPESVRSKTKQ